MKSDPTERYPDISDILKRKAEGRAELGKRSFGDKLDTLDAMRERANSLRELRIHGSVSRSFSSTRS